MLLTGRTDLASEAHRLLDAGSGLPGVSYREEARGAMRIVRVEITDRRGVQALGRPEGRYRTLELDSLLPRGSTGFTDAAQTLAGLITELFPKKPDSVLVAALGNPDITPDALGSIAAENVLVTRHLRSSSVQFREFASVSLLRTGVLGTTGIESAESVLAVCARVKPDLVVAVDALAGSDGEMLCRSVQVCDTGIAPGSGIGNNRAHLSADTLGVPVLAIGVPTVIDAALLSGREEFKGMFVTPRGIDSQVRCAGKLVGYALDLALHPSLSVSDIDLLIG